MSGAQTHDQVHETGKERDPCGLEVEITAPPVLIRQPESIAGRDRPARRRYGYGGKSGVVLTLPTSPQ